MVNVCHLCFVFHFYFGHSLPCIVFILCAAQHAGAFCLHVPNAMLEAAGLSHFNLHLELVGHKKPKGNGILAGQVAETWTRNPFLTCGFSVNSQRLCWISRYAQNPLGAAEYQKVPEMMRWFWHHLLPTLELHSLATNMRCVWLQHSFGSTTRPQSH